MDKAIQILPPWNINREIMGLLKCHQEQQL